MKKIYRKIISIAITSCLAASWWFDVNNLSVFISVIFWMLTVLAVLCVAVLTREINLFDEGEVSKEQALGKFKSFADITTFDFAFSGFMSTTNVMLLIAIDCPILAATYLISSLCVVKLNSSCKKRYDKAELMD